MRFDFVHAAVCFLHSVRICVKAIDVKSCLLDELVGRAFAIFIRMILVTFGLRDGVFFGLNCSVSRAICILVYESKNKYSTKALEN